MLTNPQTRNATAIAAVTPKTTLSRPERSGSAASTCTSSAGCGITSGGGVELGDLGADGLRQSGRRRGAYLLWVWTRMSFDRCKVGPCKAIRGRRDLDHPEPSAASRTARGGPLLLGCGAPRCRLLRRLRAGRPSSPSSAPAPTGWSPRELVARRPRTTPMKRSSRSSSLSTSQARPICVGAASVTGRWVRSLRWCSRATDIGTIAIPVPEATTSKASLTVISGKSSGVGRGDLVPALDVAGHQLLVGEVGERDLVVRRDRVLERHHDHRQLLVERDQVQPVAVDREPDEAHVGPVRRGARTPGRAPRRG